MYTELTNISDMLTQFNVEITACQRRIYLFMAGVFSRLRLVYVLPDYGTVEYNVIVETCSVE